MATFAERIKELRTSKGYTHKQLADYLGIAESTVSMWEIGKRSPTTKRLYKIADFFNVTVDYLTGKTDTYRPFKRANVQYQNDIAELMSDFGVDDDGVYMSDDELAVRDMLAVHGIKYKATADGKRIAVINGKEVEVSVKDAEAMAKRISAYAMYLFEDKLLGGDK